MVLLSNLVTPTTDPDDNFKLLSPGPVFDQAEWKKTSDQAGSDGKSVTQSYKQLDPTVLFNGGDIITLKMGGLAEIGPLIIKSVNYTVPNQYVKNKPSSMGNSIFGNSFSKLPGGSSKSVGKFFPKAEVSIKFETLFAPQSNFSVNGNMFDLDCVQLFEKIE